MKRRKTSDTTDGCDLSTSVCVRFADGGCVTVQVGLETTVEGLRQAVSSECGRTVTALYDIDVGEEELDDRVSIRQLLLNNTPSDGLDLMATEEPTGPIVIAESLGAGCNDAALAELCSAPSSATVRCMDLSNCAQLSSRGLACLQGLPLLTAISLRGCRLFRPGMGDALSSLVPKCLALSSLDISNNRLNAEGAKQIAYFLKVQW
jgi:hypothetical protein